MTFWLVLTAGLVTLAYYFLFVGWMDRRMAPAWVVRDNYRLLSAGLVFILILSLLKTVQYRTELVSLILNCQ